MSTAASNDDRRLGRPRDARVEGAVIDAARSLLAEKGFAGTTIEAIASRAGVGKATIYRRWPTREALLVAVTAVDLPPIEMPDSGDLRADLVHLFTQLSHQISSSGPASYMGDLISESTRNPAMRADFQRLVNARRALCAEVIDRAKQRGVVRKTVDPDLVLDLIGGAIVYRKLFRDEHTDAKVIQAAIDAVLDGILADS
jgi:AcrR family transcriptional regulator